MANDDARKVLRVPGRLCINPSDLSAVWPHGGTGLGSVRAVMLRRFSGCWPATAEAFGGAPVEYLEAGESWALAATVRTFQDDVVRRIFPSTAAGTVSQRRVVSAPGTVDAGAWVSGRSVVLCFTPEGATQAKSATAPDVDAPFVLIYRALPLIASDVEVPLEGGQDFGIDVVFQGIRDSSGRVMAIGPRVDLSL